MILKNYSMVGNTVLGYVYDDEKGRFLDGTYIRTSAIKREYEQDGKKYIETRNSTYELRDEDNENV